MGLFWNLAAWLVSVWVAVVAALFILAGWKEYGLRRCFRCSRLVWMSPKVRAVAAAYRVIFCGRCMPVGDQLAQVASSTRDDARRELLGRE